MAKSRAATPVIAGRVPAQLHLEIKAAAQASGRSMSDELAALARQALEHRKRFPNSAAAHAIEMVTLAFLMTGERRAKEKGLNVPFMDDLECRRAAILAACVPLITTVLSDDPGEQALAVNSLMGRVWTSMVHD